MNETVLLTAFIAFAILLLILAFILRKLTVQDFFDNTSSPAPSYAQRKLPSFEAQKNNTPKASSTPVDRGLKFDREGINKIAKIVGVVGTVMLFAPLPSSLDGVGLGLAFIGYMVAKFTTPPKDKQKSSSQNPTAQKIRQLAGKPEYQEAMKMLYADYGNKALVTDADKYRRAISHLQSKGIPFNEAQENLRLLFTLLSRQQRK